MRSFLLATVILVLASLPAGAQVRTVRLVPPSTQFVIRSYGIGFVPFDSTFTEFQGTFSYDPNDHAVCEAALTAQVASITASTAAVRDIVIGPDFLDAARYPTLRFSGRCDSLTSMSGTLTMRGITRPLRLKMDWEGSRATAQGELHRADWGMSGKGFLVGSTVRIRVTTNLP